MIAQITVTKTYNVNMSEDEASRPASVFEAQRLVTNMSVDAIERSGKLIASETGRPRIIRKSDFENECSTD